MSAYFLHQPSTASLKLSPSVTSSKQSTPRTSYDSMKAPIISEKGTSAHSHSSSQAKKEASTSKKVLQSIKQAWKEHHDSVQGAYELYYGQGTSTGRSLGNPYQKKIWGGVRECLGRGLRATAFWSLLLDSDGARFLTVQFDCDISILGS